jgi:hypothetical protein
MRGQPLARLANVMRDRSAALAMVAILASILILLALWLLDYVEEVLPRTRYRTISIRTRWRVGCIADTVDYLKRAGFDVVDASFHRSGPSLDQADIDMRIAFRSARQYYSFERQLEKDPDYQILATRETNG